MVHPGGSSFGPFLAPLLWQICWSVYFKLKLIWPATDASGSLNCLSSSRWLIMRTRTLREELRAIEDIIMSCQRTKSGRGAHVYCDPALLEWGACKKVVQWPAELQQCLSFPSETNSCSKLVTSHPHDFGNHSLKLPNTFVEVSRRRCAAPGQKFAFFGLLSAKTLITNDLMCQTWRITDGLYILKDLPWFWHEPQPATPATQPFLYIVAEGDDSNKLFFHWHSFSHS